MKKKIISIKNEILTGTFIFLSGYFTLSTLAVLSDQIDKKSLQIFLNIDKWYVWSFFKNSHCTMVMIATTNVKDDMNK